MRPQRRRGEVRLTLVVLLALLAAGTTGAAAGAPWVRSYWIEDFAATVTVAAEGRIEVLEVIRFHFDGSYQGIYRDIPLKYADNLGFNYELRFALLEVTDGSGAPLRYEVSNAGGGMRRIKAWVPGAQDASRTVRIRYSVERALRFFPEHDELYWNVTGNDWGVPIEAASAHILLPPGIGEEPRVTAYVGAYGSRGNAWRSRVVAENEVAVETTARLDFHEGLTVVVGWPKGIVAEPTPAERAGWLLADNWPLGVPLLVLVLMLLIWRRFGRDPDIDRSIMPVYEPPAELTPAEIGALVDERVDQRDIVATVVDLAVRGYLRIEERVEDRWLFDKTITTFHRLRTAGPELKPHERRIFDGIFASGDAVTIEDLQNKFYKHLPEVRKDLYQGLVDAGFFRSSPQNVRRGWIVVAVAVMVIGPMWLARTGNPAGLVAGIASGVIVLAFAPFMPSRTGRGRRRWLEVKGFEEFLGRTEGDRLRAMEVDVSKFERLLPFAMAFGVAAQWGRAFEGMLREAPNWYVGARGTTFSPGAFSTRMDIVSRSLGTAMASAPRSSSSGSSGFSGGGGSGGGFGGGGGGAF